MRRGRCAWILVCAALLIGIAAAPAHAISGVYALQASFATAGGGSLVQYTVGPGGALVASAPDIALAATPQDITVTPDGRFAYVATQPTSIVPFARVAANGRLEPARAARSPAAPRAIIVNPQGTRVLYAQGGDHLLARDQRRRHARRAGHRPRSPSARPPPDVRSLAMTADGRNLYAGDTSVGERADLAVRRRSGHRRARRQEPAGRRLARPGRRARRSAPAGWRSTPSGSHLYLATDTAGGRHRPLGDRPGDRRADRRQRRGAAAGHATPRPPSRRRSAATRCGRRAAAAVARARAHPPVRDRRRRRAHAARAGRRSTTSSPARRATSSPAPTACTLYLGQARHRRRVVVGAGRHADAPRQRRRRRRHGGWRTPASRCRRRRRRSPRSSPSPRRPARRRASTRAAPPIPTARSRATTGTSATARARRTPARRRATSTPRPAPRTVTLTVTDADGTSTAQLWTGTRTLRNGGPSALTARIVTSRDRRRPRRRGRSRGRTRAAR